MAHPRTAYRTDPAFDDEREVLQKGIQGVSAEIAPQPILGSYLPVDPVQRYTFKKWDPADWTRNIENKRFQSNRDREAARVTREEAKELINNTTIRANQTQTDVTEKLGSRSQDINYWKFELERAIRDITGENELLVEEIRRLELALQHTEGPNQIARDCLASRNRRVDTDLVQDDAEKNLLKELELISEVRDGIKRTLQNARDQLSANREAKKVLEMDWSDKFSAHHLDSRSVALKNSRGNIAYKSGSAIHNELDSHPTNWIEFSQANIRRADQEREASGRLRGNISQLLSATSQDMRDHADRVEESISRRVAETEMSVRHMEQELKDTVDEITSVESTIRALRDTHWEKQKPLKVAQTRLGNRHKRPNIELCRDEPAYRLVEEVSELEDTLKKLELKTDESEQRLRDLQHTRLALEKEIDVKNNSLVIDRDRCLKVRGLYPSTNKLSGYRTQTATAFDGIV